jgi:hypothetical protein
MEGPTKDDALGAAVIAIFFGAVVLGVLLWELRDVVINLRFRWRMRRLRAKGWRPGKCLKCGYDTRANAERCSECGEPVALLRPPPRQLLK